MSSKGILHYKTQRLVVLLDHSVDCRNIKFQFYPVRHYALSNSWEGQPLLLILIQQALTATFHRPPDPPEAPTYEPYQTLLMKLKTQMAY